jgi:hypothetical protein
MKIDRCRSCRAEIIWVKTEKGKRMPVDAAQSHRGNFFLDTATMTVYFGRGAAKTGYSSHFATCPQNAKWRKQKQSERKYGI